MRITQCARAKILNLVEPDKIFRVKASATTSDRPQIDLLPNVEKAPMDVTISSIPPIYADIQTITLLKDWSIDFDYQAEEFIISQRGQL